MALKVIHFISSFKRGGRERQMFTIYKHNDPAIQAIKILYFNNSESTYLHEFNIHPNDIIKINSTNHFGRFFEILKIIKSEKPDILFAWGWLEALYGLMVMPFCRIVFINGSIRSGIVSKKYWQYLRIGILHLSKNIVANSRAGLDANFLKRGLVLYNGIDEKFFNEISPTKEIEEFRKKLDGVILISVANLIPIKDYFTVLDALYELKKKGYKFSYLMIGEGKMRIEIENRILSLQLENEIHVLGSLQNVSDYLSIADIFINSSKGEGCSNAILEAMAHSIPIVATNVGGTPEILSKEYGLLFEFRDYKQLLNHLVTLFDDQNLRKSMSIHARKVAENKFSVNSMMNNYYKIIHEIYKKR
jgi:glycosyltransferase involved in cell wall biosynthesis